MLLKIFFFLPDVIFLEFNPPKGTISKLPTILVQ